MEKTHSMPPARTQAFYCDSLLTDWSQEVVQVKELYFDYKYKKCAALCEQLQDAAAHPLHRTFLYFYQAICYESLGKICHKYSVNRLPLLSLAKDCFGHCAAALPLPMTPDSQEDSSQSSTLCHTMTTVRDSNIEGTPMLEVAASPYAAADATESTRSRAGSASSCYGSETSTVSALSTTVSTPWHEDNLPSRRLMSKQDRSPGTPTPTLPRSRQRPHGNHHTRLSQSLSANTLVVDELVPSPLFNRSSMISLASHLPSEQGHLESQHQAALAPVKWPLTNTSTGMNMQLRDQKPLPVLPFTSNSRFLPKGMQTHELVISVSSRPSKPRPRSSILNLMFKFERATAMSQKTHSPPCVANLEFSLDQIDGTTPRLQRISRIFSPVPVEHSHLRSYLTSVVVHEHNASIISFRKSVEAHIAAVTKLIIQTIQNQEEHRLNRNHRLASFWSFDAAQQNSLDDRTDELKADNTSYRRSRIVHTPIGASRNNKPDRSDRLAQLRSCNWSVTKERHGWKGQSHYDELRKTAEHEMLSRRSRQAVRACSY